MGQSTKHWLANVETEIGISFVGDEVGPVAQINWLGVRSRCLQHLAGWSNDGDLQCSVS
ncbi:hypothetical protein PTKU46_90030 [Paraburkholderia terrae]